MIFKKKFWRKKKMPKFPEEVEKGLEEIANDVIKKTSKRFGEKKVKPYIKTIMDFLKENILSEQYTERYSLGKSIDNEEKFGVRTFAVLYVHALAALDGDFEKFKSCYSRFSSIREHFQNKMVREYAEQTQNRATMIYDVPMSKRYKPEVEVAKHTRWAANRMADRKRQSF